MIAIRLSQSPGWTLTGQAAEPAGRTRRGAQPTPPPDPFATALQETGKLEIVHTGVLSPDTRRGAEPAAGAVVLEVEVAREETHVLMVRHASGAIAFQYSSDAPEPPSRRGVRASTTKTIRFSVTVSTETEPSGARRGFVTSIIRTALLKITGKLADLALPALTRLWETAAWKLAQRREGWKIVSPTALSSKALPVLDDFSRLSTDPAKPNLLFIHGTFSNALSAFKELAATPGSGGKTLFDTVAAQYGNRIFAFDHFTVSKTPRENVDDLLRDLPPGPHVFDVITHSRGGLVLRHLNELQKDFGPAAAKAAIRRTILVASPNEGTPLASPDRFDLFVNWITNILDLFPENPFTEGVAFVSDAVGWLAHRVGGSIPGLAAMNANGSEIGNLEKTSGAGAAEYSSLVSNYQPDANMLKRIADAGVSVFFGSAHDLVVPAEGGWKSPGGVPAARIGCYGRGGNLAHPPGSPVTHISFFNRTASVDFLAHALLGQPQGLPLIDPSRPLPYLLRRAALAAAAGEPEAFAPPPSAPQLPAPPPPTERPTPIVGALRETYTSEVFYLSVIDPIQVETGRRSETPPEWAILIATFRNARAVLKMPLRHGEAGARFQKIITTKEAIRSYINGSPRVPEVPHGDELIGLGKELFETLFPGDIRRLYDEARSLQQNQRINLIFTSHVAWLADLPLEFVYDPARENFLAASEINFTRNVVTAVPADKLSGTSRPLRILVVVAQPLGLPHLSVDEEREVIVSGFRPLIQDGLAVVQVLSSATPELLHRTLENSQFDILHFIGHGEYDGPSDTGFLVFESQAGGIQKVDSKVLQQIICRRNIRLVFLNACETGTGGHTDFNRGVAPSLVQGGVPAVVGNQYSVLDVSATAFARHLYWSLGQGHTIGDAAREARVAVNYLITGEAIDWAVPVVFARDPADRLCTPRDQPSDTEKESIAREIERQRTIRRAAPGVKKIALWDVQILIPHLDQIAARLTEAQDKFIFEAVCMPAPLGTWRRETSGGVAYLRAEQVVKRIKDKPAELGVDKLLAFTNMPMRDDETEDLYAWDDDPDNRIALFSTHQFLDRLDPPLYTIERMVANAAAAFTSSLYDHKKPPKDCPHYYNAERDVRWVAGPLKFCAPDERKLKPEIREAVKALLRVYP